MILIGLILLVVGIGTGTLLVLGTSALTDPLTIKVLGGSVNLPPLTLLIAGMAAALLAWIGWELLRGGVKRSSRRRKQAKLDAQQAREAKAKAERERADADAARERSAAERERSAADGTRSEASPADGPRVEP